MFIQIENFNPAPGQHFANPDQPEGSPFAQMLAALMQAAVVMPQADAPAADVAHLPATPADADAELGEMLTEADAEYEDPQAPEAEQAETVDIEEDPGTQTDAPAAEITDTAEATETESSQQAADAAQRPETATESKAHTQTGTQQAKTDAKADARASAEAAGRAAAEANADANADAAPEAIAEPTEARPSQLALDPEGAQRPDVPVQTPISPRRLESNSRQSAGAGHPTPGTEGRAVESTDADPAPLPLKPVAPVERRVSQASRHDADQTSPATPRAPEVQTPETPKPIAERPAPMRTKPAEGSPAELARRQFEIVQQVARNIVLRNGAGESVVRVALSPPNLGAIKLKLRVENGTVSGSLVTDNAATRHLLQTNLAEMRDALAEEGLNMGSFDVSSESRESPGQAPKRNLAAAALEQSATDAQADTKTELETARVSNGRVQGYL